MSTRTLLPADMKAPLLAAMVERLPSHMHDGLLRYLELGLRPGHFLTAILKNDLAEAVSRADDENQRLIADYILVLVDHAPSDAWGSPAKVEQWLLRGAQLRSEAS